MSEVYSPFRSVGLCSNAVPLSISAKGTSVLIATAVGKAFHVYDGEKLRLLFSSPSLEDDITTLVQHRAFTYLGCGGYLKCFKRGKECWSVREGDSDVTMILLVGEHLLSIHNNNVLKIWDINSKDVYSEVSFDRKSFIVSSIVHPSTYLNKVLLGSAQGPLQLWNIRTGKLVYSFTGWDSAVLTLVQSPALDVVGVGLGNGNVELHNIRTDLSLMTFTQTLGPVTTIAFRTDGINHMLTGSSRSGDIVVWDLDSRRLECVISDAHSGSVNGMMCLPQQPLLVTCSEDNSVKIWIFDNNNARLLKERSGHSAPPTLIRFINRSSLISAGLDKSVRVISLHNDSHNKEMSQGTKKGKGSKSAAAAATVCDLAFELTRRYEWDAMVTCHHGNRSGLTWSLCNSSIGSHSLKLKQAGATPLCCTVSGCGNYTVLGGSHGDIEVFNMQSGMRRKHITKAHSGAVRGVAINVLCTEIYSCGSDGLIKVWSYADATLIATVSLGCPLSKQCYHSNSSLLAVATDLCDVIICDMDTRTIVRQFTGHNMRITDLCFTCDGRWILTAAMDCTIRTWDVPSGHLLDCMVLDAPPTSVTMSPSGEYLAASIVDEVGIRIWVNTTLYTPHKPRPLMTATPSLSPLEGGLITLSGLATPHWVNLTNLDTIKERNKPVEPPKQPKQTPFFLPTLSGLEMSFDSSHHDEIPEQEMDQVSRIKELSKVMNEDSLFQRQLTSNTTTGSGMDVLKSLGPAQIDREIQLLSGREQCSAFLQLILDSLKSCKDFELTESYLSLYLKYHRATTDWELLEEIFTEHKKSWKLLQEQFNFSLCLLTYCKHFSV